jgi:hypothetical protein
MPQRHDVGAVEDGLRAHRLIARAGAGAYDESMTQAELRTPSPTIQVDRTT